MTFFKVFLRVGASGPPLAHLPRHYGGPLTPNAGQLGPPNFVLTLSTLEIHDTAKIYYVLYTFKMYNILFCIMNRLEIN